MDTSVLVTGFAFLGGCLGFFCGVCFWAFFFGGFSRG